MFYACSLYNIVSQPHLNKKEKKSQKFCTLN